MEADCYLTIPHHTIFPNDIRHGRRHSNGDKFPILNFSLETITHTKLSSIASKEKTHHNRSKSEENDRLPSKFNNRPSTAVRLHVKKISDDFTITQTNFENSHKSNSIIISIERPKSITPRLPKGISAAQSSCAKCDRLCQNSAKGLLLSVSPIERKLDPHPSLPSNYSTTNTLSAIRKKLDLTTPSLEPVSSTSSRITAIDSLSAASSSPKCSRTSSPGAIGSNPSSPSVRSNSRRYRTCISPKGGGALGVTSPRLQQVTLSQLKKARKFTERAIKVRFLEKNSSETFDILNIHKPKIKDDLS